MKIWKFLIVFLIVPVLYTHLLWLPQEKKDRRAEIEAILSEKDAERKALLKENIKGLVHITLLVRPGGIQGDWGMSKFTVGFVYGNKVITVRHIYARVCDPRDKDFDFFCFLHPEYEEEEIISCTATILNADFRCGQGKRLDGLDITVLNLLTDETLLRNLPRVRIGNSEKLEIGDRVCAIGDPLRLKESVACGVVSASSRIDERLSDGLNDEKTVFIQFDIPINPGNSGGFLIKEYTGEVVGIIVMDFSDGDGLSFAIPMNTILRALQAQGITP